MIKFYFADGTEQVLNPSKAFFNHTEIENKWVNNKPKRVTLTLKERISRIASDLGAVSFKVN